MNIDERIFVKLQEVADEIQEGVERFFGLLNYAIKVFAVLASFYIFAVLTDQGHVAVAPVFLVLFVAAVHYWRGNNVTTE